VRHVLAMGLLAAATSGCDGLGAGPSGAASASSSTHLPPGAIPVTTSAVVPPSVASAPTARAASPSGLPSFSSLVKKARPAVVTVRSWVTKRNAFGRTIAEAQGVGTGFVYDDRGYLLTNNHVIDGADQVMITFEDGQEVDGTVVGADKPTDVAVLKVDKSGLSALPLGDSEALEVGDWVVAIGNPFGLEYTVSAGILSARGRTRDDVRGLDPAGYFSFLQTDASINPGNSGGPLINLAGQVVGINAAVRANANNIGFAIPMEMVVQLLPMLLKEGRIRRSAMGIMVDELSQGDTQRLDGKRVGVKVTRVFPGKGGDAAGLSVGDIILEFDGKPVKGGEHLRWLASIAGVNKVVPLRVVRGDRTFDMRLTLTELSED
jgi:serine protease Do